jgi:hypothetical protein
MRIGKWMVFGVALGMIAATAGWLAELRQRVNLGAPGVKVQPAGLYDPAGRLVSPRSVVLPANLPGFQSRAVVIASNELSSLPADTTFGRQYFYSNDFGVQVGVVLMGRDHTSIHQPQYCLDAQDWTITNTERISLRMERPYPYDIPAIELLATRPLGDGQLAHGIYVYWFVSGDKITAEEGSRLWSQWKSVLQKGVTERWAYISYFTTCHAGEESDTFQRLLSFIRSSVPEFQTVTGGRMDSAAPGKAGK